MKRSILDDNFGQKLLLLFPRCNSSGLCICGDQMSTLLFLEAVMDPVILEQFSVVLNSTVFYLNDSRA